MSNLRSIAPVPVYRDPNGRQPPHAAELEADVISHVLWTAHRSTKAEPIEEATRQLRAADFHVPLHATIWESIETVRDYGAPLNMQTVRDNLQARGQLAAIGGAATIYKLVESRPAVAQFERVIARLRDLAVLRRHLASMWARVCEGYGDVGSIHGFIAASEVEIGEHYAKLSGTEPGSFSELVRRNVKARLDGEKTFWIRTGIDPLDEVVSGLFGSDVTVLAARPGVGKSALAMAIALHVGAQVENDLSLGSFVSSLEMREEELTGRAICARAGIDFPRWRKGEIHPDEWRAVYEAQEHLERVLLEIDDTPKQTCHHVRSRVREVNVRWKRAGKKLALVVVDFLQDLDAKALCDRGAPEHERIAEAMGFCRTMARALRVPVLVLAACKNPENAKESKQRPTVRDIYGGSKIASQADGLWIMHREEVSNPSTTKKGLVELAIPKARHGKTGRVFMKFDRGRFGPWDAQTSIPTASRNFEDIED